MPSKFLDDEEVLDCHSVADEKDKEDDGAAEGSSSDVFDEQPRRKARTVGRKRRSKKKDQDGTLTVPKSGTSSSQGQTQTVKSKARKSHLDNVETSLLVAHIRSLGATACVCLSVSRDFPAPVIKAHARSVRQNQTAGNRQKLPAPNSIAAALPYFCPAHLLNFQGVAETLKKASLKSTSIGMFEDAASEFLRNLPELHGANAVVEHVGIENDGNEIVPLAQGASAGHQPWLDVLVPSDNNINAARREPSSQGPDLAPGTAWSVFEAYMFYLHRVVLPNINLEDVAQLTLLIPHLLRDAHVNHTWHIVEGFYRVGGMGFQRRNGVFNFGNFLFIMSHTPQHYIGVHTHCGLTRTTNMICVTSVLVPQNGPLPFIILDAALAFARFVCRFRVLNIRIPFSHQSLLQWYFRSPRPRDDIRPEVPAGIPMPEVH